MIDKIKSSWEEIITFLRDDYELSPVSYNTWIKPMVPTSIDKDSKGNYTLIITVPSLPFKAYVTKKYSLYLSVSIEEVTLIKCNVVFREKSEQENKKVQNMLIDNKRHPVNNLKLLSANLDPLYTFDTFVVGKSNDLAHATAIAVAESPGSQNPGEHYNPFFIYGGVGLGKTHLMHSIAHYILEHNPEAIILYVSSEKFLNEYIDALKNSNLQEYRSKYRNVDVLLIDDIQFIGGKDAIQEELFHTFNALYEQKKQIILSSDRPPMELKNLEERLRSRFAWGVAVEIFSPDFETRMAILRSKEERDGKNIDNEVIQFIATNIKSNIRMLEGALNKLYAMSRLNKNKEIDIELAKTVLKDMITPDAPTKITSEYIATVVADHFNITVAELKAKGRKEPVATARHITVYLCRKMTNDTQTKIGQFLGDRDHSTIVNSEDVITKRIVSDSELNQTIETIKKKISPQ